MLLSNLNRGKRYGKGLITELILHLHISYVRILIKKTRS
nr:MAG TPA: hypothetical protein [Bacteriophage sp.]